MKEDNYCIIWDKEAAGYYTTRQIPRKGLGDKQRIYYASIG